MRKHWVAHALALFNAVRESVPHALPQMRCDCAQSATVAIIRINNTRQGYARQRILKPAGYFFARRKT